MNKNFDISLPGIALLTFALVLILVLCAHQRDRKLTHRAIVIDAEQCGSCYIFPKGWGTEKERTAMVAYGSIGNEVLGTRSNLASDAPCG